MKNDFGNRMKEYEGEETHDKFDDYLPLVFRLDGRAFSKFTKKLDRPFDLSFRDSMQTITKRLMKDFNADLAYHQSDEISLLFNAIDEDSETQRTFSGKKQKLCSVLAGQATAIFLVEMLKYKPEMSEYIINSLPHFDCRGFNLPTDVEAANCMIWRSQDASRNAISMIASSLFSHKQLDGKSTVERLEMIKENSDYFSENDSLDRDLKYGAFFVKEPEERNGVLRSSMVKHVIERPTFIDVLNMAGIKKEIEQTKTQSPGF